MTLLLNVQPGALQPGDLDTLRGVADGALWIFAAGEEAAVRAAVAAWPDGYHVARPYPAPWAAFDPTGFRAVVIGNEPNLPPDQEPDSWRFDPAGYVQAKLDLVAALRRRAPAAAIVSPALSPGVPGWEDDLLAYWPLVAACDVVGVHRYAGVDTVAAYRTAFSGARLWVTEQGWPHGDPLWVAGDLDLVALFAARWQGHAADGWDLLARPDVLSRMPALRAAPQNPPNSSPGSPPAAPSGPASPQPPSPGKEPAVTATDYCTQIDPFGSGEERCGPAGGASAMCSLIPGDYDNYQLMRAWTAAINALHGDPNHVQANGCTSADLIAVAPQFHLTARTWTTWDEYAAASGKGEIVLAMLQNQLLEPRPYPAGAGWDAQHWLRIEPLVYHGKTDVVFLLGFDPLCYLLGEYSGAYQGPLCFTVQSVRAAIQASSAVEAGVIFAKG